MIIQAYKMKICCRVESFTVLDNKNTYRHIHMEIELKKVRYGPYLLSLALHPAMAEILTAVEIYQCEL